MRHMLAGPNIGLVSSRSNKSPSPDHFFCSPFVTEAKTGESTTQSYLFPLYLYPEPGQTTYHRSDAIEAARKAIRGREGLSPKEMSEQLNAVAEQVRRLYPEEEYPRWPNLAPDFLAEIETRLGLRYVPDTRPEGAPSGDTLTPEDVFHYMYAVLHSPTYRSRYAPFLKSDFPRVSLTSDRALFRDLVSLGSELVALHLMRAPELSQPASSYPQAGTDLVERVTYDEQERRVFINKTQHFTHVPPEVWEFHVGGYQVAEKWLKDRRGRKLSYDDQQHYKGIITVLGRTIELMARIDQRIPAWPLE